MKKFIVLSLVLSTLVMGEGFTNSIGMKFIDIPAGNFIMGKQAENCPKDDPYTDKNEYEECMNTAKNSLNVSVDSFYMQNTEVTQAQWYEIMGNNPSKYKTGNSSMPVEQLSFNDVQKFIKLLNAKEGTTKYAMPTEIQWEYASCAGAPIERGCDMASEKCVDTITLHGVESPKPVANKNPNKWGLYDMNGNVWEWVSNCYQDNSNNDTSLIGKNSECKCCWVNVVDDFNSVARFNYSSDYRYFSVGFRLVMAK